MGSGEGVLAFCGCVEWPSPELGAWCCVWRGLDCSVDLVLMSAERTTTMRLRSVRFKDGRAPIRVFQRPVDTEIADLFSDSANRCAGGDVGGAAMAGFAILAWTAGGQVYVNFQNGVRSPVSAGAVGQYAKDVIQAEQAVRWSHE